LNEDAVPAPTGLRGWLLLLVLLLLLWHPASFAITAAASVGSLRVRGAPMFLLLVVRLLVIGIGVGAGILLAGRRPGSPGVAQWALALSMATDFVVYLTPYFPSNRLPGDTPLYVAATSVYHAAWILYLRRSRRVRNTIPADG
jgi:hypothetical protein